MLGYMLPYLPWLLISLGVSLFIVIFDAMSLWISTTLFSTLFNPDSLDIAKPAFKFANINEILKYWTAKLWQCGSPLRRVWLSLRERAVWAG